MEKKQQIKDELDDLKHRKILSFKKYTREMKKIEKLRDQELDSWDIKIHKAEKEKKELDKQSRQ